jgi:GNAT superfamily N-acetyltransferase
VLVDIDNVSEAAQVWGYVTLVASQTETTDDTRPANVDWPNAFHLPSVKLARMAIDDRLRGNGAGRFTMDWVIAHLLDNVCKHIGCRLFITDAKQDAVGFYEKMGFKLLDTETNRAAAEPVMFIDLLKLPAL